jgi:hypothetical protein
VGPLETAKSEREAAKAKQVATESEDKVVHRSRCPTQTPLKVPVNFMEAVDTSVSKLLYGANL